MGSEILNCSILSCAVGNECLKQLCICLQAHFSSFSSELLEYLLHQIDYQDFQELPSNEHALSVVNILLQV